MEELIGRGKVLTLAMQQEYGYEAKVLMGVSNRSPVKENIPRHKLADWTTARVTLDSVEGEKLYSQADAHKRVGNEYIGEKNPEQALIHYLKALRHATEVENNFTQTSILFSNASHALCSLGKGEKAIYFSMLCTESRPRWYKGVLRLAQAQRDQFTKLLMHCLLLERIKNDEFDEPSNQEMVSILTNSIKLASHLSDKQGYVELAQLDIKQDLWQSSLKKLMNDKEWNIVRDLVAGSAAILSAFSVEGVDLGDLWRFCSDKAWKDWGQKLTVKLLHHGAKYQDMTVSDSTGLHAIFTIARKTGQYQLLQHVFLHVIPLSDRQTVDRQGNTILHIACREKYPSKISAIRLLLDMGLDYTIRNSEDRTAVDCLAADEDEARKVINDKLTDQDSLAMTDSC